MRHLPKKGDPPSTSGPTVSLNLSNHPPRVRKKKPPYGAQVAVTQSSEWRSAWTAELVVCPNCSAVVVRADMQQHVQWHDELSEVIGSFLAKRLRELEEDLSGQAEPGPESE